LDAFGDAQDETWYGEGDDGGEPISINMLRYETDAGYYQSMSLHFSWDDALEEIHLINYVILDELPVSCEHQYAQDEIAATCTTDGRLIGTCIHCGDSWTEILSATGHSFAEGICSRCGEADPSVPAEVTYTVTVRSDKGKVIPDVIVSVYTGGDQPAATGITNEKGIATMTLLSAASYTIKLSHIPPGSSCKESYTSTSTRVNINLTSFSTVEPTDHSKANYKVGSVMGEFTLTDTDGNSYTLSDLLQNKKLIVLNFWFVNCGPCKEEFPYFQALHDKYAEDVQLLTLNHIDKKSDIIALREQSGYTFPMIAENIGLRQGFGMSMYPTTVLIGSNGKILRIITGSFLSEQDLIDTIQPFL
jgi:thiol-disulfide isomerase/thioredoxin